MRLAVVSPFVDRSHGTERAVAELLERLARDYACEIHLYAQRVDQVRVKDPRALRTGETGAIYWHRVPSVPGPHVLQFLGWMFLNGLYRRLDTRFRGLKFDLVLSPGINCLHADVVIVHVLFHRLRELAMEQDPRETARAGIFRRWHRQAYYRLLTVLERRIYGNPAVKLAAVSRRTAQLLNAYCNRQDVLVVPNGVDAKHFCPEKRLALRKDARRSWRVRDDECVLLMIGNDWRTKGLLAILEAMSALRELPLRLIVAGNDDAEYFRSVARQLGVQDRCEWESPRSDVIDFYAAADIYVSPSWEDSFGLPVAEAMACGIPAITSRCAGVAALVQDGVDGFIMDEPTDAHALGKLIQRLQSSPELRHRVGDAAILKAAGWSWDHHTKAIWELLSSVAGAQASASKRK